MTSSGEVVDVKPQPKTRAALAIFGFLVFPLALLLFAQWPLREVVQAFSRQANDVAQIIFAFYMAVAISAASSARVHLASTHSQTGNATEPRWRAIVLFVCIAPWAVFMLWASWPVVLNSALSAERFGETLTPGYFLIKLALPLMLLLVLVEGAARLFTTRAD